MKKLGGTEEKKRQPPRKSEVKKVQIRHMDLRETGYKEKRLEENFYSAEEGKYNIVCLASKEDTQDSNDRPRNKRRNAPRRNISCTSCGAERKDAETSC